MTGASSTAPATWRRRLLPLLRRLPARPTRALTIAAWASFVANVLIIATGGAVRLTGSGLGCPTWPLCTPDSLVSTPEMGIHGVIEFANRTLTGALGIIAVAVLLLVLRMRRARPDLFDLAVVVAGGILVQALLGGVTVLTGLNPFVVGVHYVVSTALVCVCAIFLFRLHTPSRPAPRSRSRLLRPASVTVAGLAAVTTVLGVLTTGAGPHSGDVVAARNGFDATVLQHLHAAPSYALVAVSALALVLAWRAGSPALGPAAVLLAVEVVQVAVGLFQARSGLPPLAVGVHMVLAALLAAAATWLVCTVHASHRHESHRQEPHRHEPNRRVTAQG